MSDFDCESLSEHEPGGGGVESPSEHGRSEREALAEGADIADDLTALELALIAAIEEEEPLDFERRQCALRAITRLLGARAVQLHEIFAVLWATCKLE